MWIWGEVMFFLVLWRNMAYRRHAGHRHRFQDLFFYRHLSSEFPESFKLRFAPVVCFYFLQGYSLNYLRIDQKFGMVWVFFRYVFTCLRSSLCVVLCWAFSLSYKKCSPVLLWDLHLGRIGVDLSLHCTCFRAFFDSISLSMDVQSGRVFGLAL